jgi:hypothetical protein
MKTKMFGFDDSDLTLAQMKAGEQPRDSRGRFVSNSDFSPEDEIRADIVPWGLQANAIGNPLAFDEDPFGFVDEMIDVETTGRLSTDEYDLEEDNFEEELLKSSRGFDTPKERKERHARSSNLRIAAVKQRRRYQHEFWTQQPRVEDSSMATL